MFRLISVFQTTAMLKFANSQSGICLLIAPVPVHCFSLTFFTALSSGSFCQMYRVTDEALIVETAVWPSFFLMNVFFALKGSKRFNIIYDTDSLA